MRVSLFAAVFMPLVFTSANSGQENVVPKRQLEVHIALNRAEFHLGEPIELKLEITNVGQEPLLIPDNVSLFGDADAFLELELHGKKGLVLPRMGWASDCFPTPEKESKAPSEILLGTFLLLRPGTSYVQRLTIHERLRALQYELKPGYHTLRTYYSSDGLLVPSMCGTQGVTANDIKALPFRTWHGKVGTNKVSFRILPRV